MGYNQSKQYRISHTEEKIIDLLRDKEAWQQIYDTVVYDKRFVSYANLNFLLSIFEGKMSFSNDNNYRRGSVTRSVIKRLKENEFMALMWIRNHGATTFLDMKDNCDYDLMSENAYLFKLYNLISRGISKTFEDLIKADFCTVGQETRLRTMISNNENILIGGELDTGKIVLLNALLYSLNEQKKKVLVVDEKSELQLDYVSENISVCSYKDLNMDLLDSFDKEEYTIVSTNLASNKTLCFLKAIQSYLISDKVNIVGIFPSGSFKDYLMSIDEQSEHMFSRFERRMVYTSRRDDKKFIVEMI